MIVNYIRFLRPNDFEYSVEESIPDNIDRILQSTMYKDCFYQWFGYQPNLYNIIYKYNSYRELFHFSDIIFRLNKTLGIETLDLQNVHHVYEFYKTQTHSLYFETFLKNTVDISSYFSKKTKICLSLMESLENE
jgi:hypothetical protein